jgi:hypothetical protein
MTATSFASRAFERSLGSPAISGPDSAGDSTARKFSRERLMQVTLRHSYYNRSNPAEACPDFKISPTAASSHLMNQLGLLFRDEGTSFSILYDKLREDTLLEYLRRQKQFNEKGQCWSRLSFVLALNNPYFVNFTALPISLNPASQNFYLTNQQAQRKPDGEVRLDWGASGSLLPVVPVNFPVPQLSGVDWNQVQEIRVHDISGERVLCKPRCVPKDLLDPEDTLKKPKGLAAITCEEAEECKGPDDLECTCAETIYLDFSLLPEDKYTIDEVTFSGTHSAADAGAVLYTTSYPTPLYFLDLLFTSPSGENPNLYPIRNLVPTENDKTIVKLINYELKFEARKTFWNYYVVPPPGETFQNLEIEGEPAMDFEGPWDVNLPNGTPAYRFVSRKPLPFRQQSPFRFRLRGELTLTSSFGTLIDRLPVPPIGQVLQDEVTACLGLDKMIAAGAKGEARKLKAQLCNCLFKNFGAGLSLDERLERIRQRCADSQSRACQELSLHCSKLYSDAYVYV